jgi:hypothetical protein
MPQLSSGIVTRRILRIPAVSIPVAMLTAGSVPWNWGLVLTYLFMGLLLQLFARLKDPDHERFLHVGVLAGASSFVLRFSDSNPTGIAGTLHVGALICTSIAVGYLLAHLIRPRPAIVEDRSGT